MISGPNKILLTPITFTHQPHLPEEDYDVFFRGFADEPPTEPASEIRKIVSIEGYPFYCSTGDNSGHENTWFPFTGIMETNYRNFNKGWFIKPYLTSEISQEIKDIFQRCFPYEPSAGKNLADRFATLPALLISAELGGGFWDTSIGLKLKQDLKNKYPNFQPHFTLMNVDKNFNDDQLERINQWLCAAAKIESREKLQIPQKFDNFTFYQKSIEEKRTRGLHAAYKGEQDKRAYFTRALGQKTYFRRAENKIKGA